MDFSIKTFDSKNTIAQFKTGCMAVGIFESGKLSRAAQDLDSQGEISAAVKSGDISGKPGTTLLMRRISGATAERILLIGLGKDESIGTKDFSTVLQSMTRVFATLGANDAVAVLPFDRIQDRDVAWAIGNAVRAA